jgi:hypothetical protein
MARPYLEALYWAIKRRCLDKSDPGYINYGGRGILMSPEWVHDRQAFEIWILTNLGPRPEGLTLDRMNNDGHYEPGNLRWATYKTQANNRRLVPTNTGEPSISYDSKHRCYKVFNGSKYVGSRKSLAEAINLRDSRHV